MNQDINAFNDKSKELQDDLTAGLDGVPSDEGNTVPITQGFNRRDIEELKRLARCARAHVNEKDRGDSSFSLRNTLLNAADRAINLASEYDAAGDIFGLKIAQTYADTMINTALSLTPFLGWGKDVYEAISGKNLVTREPLDSFDRTMAILGAATVGIGSMEFPKNQDRVY